MVVHQHLGPEVGNQPVVVLKGDSALRRLKMPCSGIRRRLGREQRRAASAGCAGRAVRQPCGPGRPPRLRLGIRDCQCAPGGPTVTAGTNQLLIYNSRRPGTPAGPCWWPRGACSAGQYAPDRTCAGEPHGIHDARLSWCSSSRSSSAMSR